MTINLAGSWALHDHYDHGLVVEGLPVMSKSLARDAEDPLLAVTVDGLRSRVLRG
jgi:hypothetical protein